MKQPAEIRNRPPQVSRVGFLMLASCVVGLTGVFVACHELGFPTRIGAIYSLVALPGLAVSLMLLVAILEGRNWARWILLVSTIYSALIVCLDAMLQWNWVPITTLLGLFALGLQFAAAILVFTPASKSWFVRAGADV